MRVLGVDPSSTIGGVAVIDTPADVKCVDHWKRTKGTTHPQGLVSWFHWLQAFIGMWEPHMATIEMHAYTGVKANSQASHSVSFYQGVAALCCKISGLMVVEVRVSSARRIVLGNGSLSKDAAWEIMRKRYPDLFSGKEAGGLDECDALTAALAGESAAEA